MRPIILIICFLFCNYLFAKRHKAENFAVVSATKQNIVYLGIDNPIQVAVSGLPRHKMTVSCTNGTITGVGGLYVLRPDSVGLTKVIVYSLKNGDTVSYGDFPFRAHRFPNPVAKVGGYTGGEISLPVMKAQQGVIADLDGFDFDIRFDVIQFKALVTKKDKTLISDLVYGPYFSPQIKTWMKELETGNDFIVYKIKVKGPDGLIRELNPIYFTMK